MDELITITILFIFFFTLLMLIRFICYLFFKALIKRYKAILAKLSKSNDNLPPEILKLNSLPKDEEAQHRNKQKEIKKEKEYSIAIRLNEKENDLSEQFAQDKEVNKTKIIGIVKPIGKWTSLILGQKVVGLMQNAQMLQQQNDLGYWTNMMHSQRKSKGKERGGR